MALAVVAFLVAGVVVGVALAVTGDLGAESRGLYVDRDSVGGKCSDRRSAKEVSSGKPWCTLDRAIAAAPSGSTLLVRRGRYPAFEVRGRRSAYVTVKAAPDERVVLTKGLKVEDPDYLRTHERTLNAAFLRFEGFRITGPVELFEGAQHIQLVGNDISPYGVHLKLAWDVLVERNYIHDLADEVPGLGADGYEERAYREAAGGTHDLTVRGNHFARLTNDAISIYNGVRGLLIERNEIEEARFLGEPKPHVDSIQFAGLSYGNHDVEIRSNFIHDNSYGILFLDGRSEDVRVENNLFARIEALGVDVHDTHGMHVVDNTNWGSHWGLRVSSDSSEVSIRRNVLDKLEAPEAVLVDTGQNLIGERAGNAPAPDDPTGQPRFQNPQELDYRLRAGSPGADDGLGTDVSP